MDRFSAFAEGTWAGWGSAGHRRCPPWAAAAVHAVFLGASVQRCRVHFLRNVFAQGPKGSAEMVTAAIRTIFAQPDALTSTINST